MRFFHRKFHISLEKIIFVNYFSILLTVKGPFAGIKVHSFGFAVRGAAFIVATFLDAANRSTAAETAGGLNVATFAAAATANRSAAAAGRFTAAAAVFNVATTPQTANRCAVRRYRKPLGGVNVAVALHICNHISLNHEFTTQQIQ